MLLVKTNIFVNLFAITILSFSILGPQFKEIISKLYLQFPDLYTKKGLIRKQANRRRNPVAKPPLRIVPQIILDILIGSLLGDCHGTIPFKGINPVFEFKQSTIHSAYLFYMYFIFLHWGYSNLSFPIVYFTGDSAGNKHSYLRFRTIANVMLMSVYQSFYPNGGTKILPINIFDLLTPRALAFWIMDDGGAHTSGMTLHCNNFSEVEVDTLITVFQLKFGITATKWAKGNNHILYINSSSMPILRLLVTKHIHTSFQYKLGLVR